jgi:Helix-hairpin-helix domain
MAVQDPRIYADINAVVGGYLRDLAFAQSSQQKMFGYKRAAAAIFALDMPLTDVVSPDGTWPKIPGIGPGSARVIREVLETGGSPTVEQAIESMGSRTARSRSRVGGRRLGGWLPVRTGQRRAYHRTALVCRDRGRTCASRRHSSRANRELLAARPASGLASESILRERRP